MKTSSMKRRIAMVMAMTMILSSVPSNASFAYAGETDVVAESSEELLVEGGTGEEATHDHGAELIDDTTVVDGVTGADLLSAANNAESLPDDGLIAVDDDGLLEDIPELTDEGESGSAGSVDGMIPDGTTADETTVDGIADESETRTEEAIEETLSKDDEDGIALFSEEAETEEQTAAFSIDTENPAVPTDAYELTVDNAATIFCEQGDFKWYHFTAQKTGDYFLSFLRSGGTMNNSLQPWVYAKNEDSLMCISRDQWIGADGYVTFSADAGTEYYLLVLNNSSETLPWQGSLTLAEKKVITGIRFDMDSINCNAGRLRTELWKIPVTAIYNNGEKEEHITSWSGYGDGLSCNSSGGDFIILKLQQDQTDVRMPEYNELVSGDFKLVVSVENNNTVTSSMDVHSEPMQFSPIGEVAKQEFTITAGSYIGYDFTAQTAGNYFLRTEPTDGNNSVLDVGIYQKDGDKLAYVSGNAWLWGNYAYSFEAEQGGHYYVLMKLGNDNYPDYTGYLTLKEKKTVTGIKIDESAPTEYDAFSFANDISKTPVKVIYNNDSSDTEQITSWQRTQRYDQNTGTYYDVMTSFSANGDNIYMQLCRSGELIDIPNDVKFVGPLELKLTVDNTSLKDTLGITSVISSPTALTEDESEILSVTSGEKKIYDFVAPKDGSYYLKFKQEEDTYGYAEATIYKEENQILTYAKNDSWIGSSDAIIFDALEGQHYYVSISTTGGYESYTGSITVNEKMNITDIRFDIASINCSAARLYDEQWKTPITVVYNKGEKEEQITNWNGWSRETENGLYQYSSEGDYIELKFQQGQTDIRMPEYNELVSGDFKLVVSFGGNDTVTSSIDVHSEPMQFVTIGEVTEQNFTITAGSYVGYDFTAPATGTYFLKTERADDNASGLDVRIYKKDGEKFIYVSGDTYIWGNYDYSFETEQGEHYYVLMNVCDDNSPDYTGYLTLKKKKTITGITIDDTAPETFDALDLTSQLKKMSVTLTYNGNPSDIEQITAWERNWINDEPDTGSYYGLSGYSENGDEIRLKLTKNSQTVSLPQEDSSGEAQCGDFVVTGYVVDTVTMADTRNITVNIQASEAVLDENGEFSGDIVIDEAGTSGYVKFTPDVTKKYVFQSNSNADTYAYLYKNSEATGNLSHIAEDDDGGKNNNFRISTELTAGVTYYLKVKFNSNDRTGTIPISIKKCKNITAIYIEDGLPDQYDVFELSSKLNKSVVTVTYEDNASDTEKINSWLNCWATDQNGYDYNVLYAHTDAGEELRIKLTQGDRGVSIDPMDTDLNANILYGNVVMTAYVYNNEKLSDMKNVVINDPTESAAALTMGVEEQYSVTDTKAKVYRITTPGKHILKFISTGDYTAKINLFKENGENQLSFVQSYGDSGTYQLDVNAGEVYYITVNCRSTDDTSEGTVLLTEKKTISYITMHPVTCEPAKAGDDLKKYPLTVNYSDGTSEILKSWAKKTISVKNAAGATVKRRVRTATTKNMDTIQLQLSNEAGLVDMPIQFTYSAENILTGSYTLTPVVVGSEQKYEGCEVTVTTLEDQKPTELQRNQEQSFTLNKNQAAYYTFQLTEDGSYIIRMDSDSYDTICRVFSIEDGRMEFLTGGENNVYSEEVNLEKDKNYGLVVYGRSNGTEGTLSINSKKKVQGLSFTANQNYSVLSLADEMASLPVSVIYEDDTEATEMISEWTEDYIEDWTDEEGYNEIKIYSAITRNQDRLYLVLKDLEGNLVNVDSQVPFAQYKICVYMVNDSEISTEQKIDVIPYPSDYTVVNGNEPAVTATVEDGQRSYFLLKPDADGEFIISQKELSGDVNSFLYMISNNSLGEINNFRSTSGMQLRMLTDETYVLCMESDAERYDEEETSSRVQLSLYNKKSVKSVAFADSANTYSAVSVCKDLRNTDIVITYTDDTTETVNYWNPDWQYNEVYDEEDDYYYDDYVYSGMLHAVTDNQDRIFLRLKKDSKNVRIPVEYNSDDEYSKQDYNIALGSMKFEVYLGDSEEVSSTKDITIDGVGAATNLPLNQELAYNVASGPAGFLLQPEESGDYVISHDRYSDDDYYYDYIYASLYEVTETQLTYKRVISGSGSSYLEAGHSYCLVIPRRDGDSTGSVRFEKEKLLTGISLEASDYHTEYIAGLDTLENMMALVRVNYGADDSETVKLPNSYDYRDKYVYGYDRFGQYIEMRLYDTKEVDGELTINEVIHDRENLKAGTYMLVAKTDVYNVDTEEDDTITAQLPIKVITKQEAAAKHIYPADGSSITLTGNDGYYECVSYTPSEDGYYAVDTAMGLENTCLFDADGNEVKDVAANAYHTTATLKKDETYIIAVRTAPEAGSYELTVGAGNAIDKVVVSASQTEYIAGLDEINYGSLQTDVSYHDGTQVTLNSAEENTIYGDGFRYEIKEKTTGEIVNEENVTSNSGIGSYLVSAIHRTLSAIRSANEVEIEVKTLDVAGLTELTTASETQISASKERQLFAFRPDVDGYYELKSETDIINSIYEYASNGQLNYTGGYDDYLTAGKTYVVQLYQVGAAQKIKMSLVEDTAAGTSQEYPGKGTAQSISFTPQEDGDYVFLAEYTGTEDKDRSIQLSLYSGDGECLRNADGQGFVRSQVNDLKTGETCLIHLSGDISARSDYKLSVYKASEAPEKTVGSITAEPKYKHLIAPFEAMYNFRDLFTITLHFTDGSSANASYYNPYDDEDMVSYDAEKVDETNDAVTYEITFKAAGKSVTKTVTLDKDVTGLTELTEGTKDNSYASQKVTVTGDRYEYFKFIPSESGTYYFAADAYGFLHYKEANGRVMGTDNNALQVKAGKTYYIAYEPGSILSAGSELEISILKGSTVTGMKKRTDAQSFITGLEYAGEGFTAEVTYANGDIRVVNARENTSDAYGHELSLSSSALSEGMTRIYMTCEGYRVYSDVKNNDISGRNLPELVSGEEKKIPVEAGGDRILTVFKPTTSGSYDFKVNLDGTVPIRSQICDLSDDKAYMLPAVLDAGKTYVFRCDIQSNSKQDMSIQVVRIGAPVCEGGHTIEIDKAVAATCTESGLTEGSHCEACNATIVAQTVIPAKGHTAVVDPEVPATCTEAGKSAGSHCQVCNTIIVAQTVIPAKGHTIVVDPAVPPTCTTDGKTEGSHCSVCDAVLKAQTIIPKFGHTEVVDKAVAATCTKAGKTEGRHCSVCDEILLAQEVIEATRHSIVVDPKVDVTCTTDGLTEGSHCNICGEVIKTQEVIKATGHNWSDYVETKAPTCLATGVETSACSKCNEKRTKTIPKIDHTWDVGNITTPATGDDDGTMTFTCGGCHLTRIEIIPALGHNWNNGEVTKKATCTEKGEITYTCTDAGCGKTRTEETPALGHKWNAGYTIDIPVTCTAVGSKSVHCSVCGAKDERTVAAIPATGHSWNAGEVTKEAGCTTDGIRTYHCTNDGCEGIKTEVIPATGHQIVTDLAVAATCTEAGTTAGSHCDKCGKVIVAPRTVKATGHTIVIKPAEAPTCTTAGKTEGSYCFVCSHIIVAQEELPAAHTIVTDEAVDAACTQAGLTEGSHCSVCGTVIKAQEKISAKGHTWDAGEVTKPATETEDGVRRFTCTVCGEQKTEVIPQITHTWDAGGVTKEPTCTQKGEMTYTCTDTGCTATRVVEIAAKGHTWDAGVVSKAATCTEKGEKVYTCSVCHQTRKEEIPVAGHKWAAKMTVDQAPACTRTGTQSLHCLICGESNTETSMPVVATGHTWDAGIVTVQPTCTKTGIRTYTCSSCHETKTEVLPRKAHNWETEYSTDVEPTCMTYGSQSIHCHDCGAKMAASVLPLAPIAHRFGAWDEQSATCTTDGWKIRTCQTEGCGYTELETIKAIGHDYGEEQTEDYGTNMTRIFRECNNCHEILVLSINIKPEEQQRIDAASNAVTAEDISTADALAQIAELDNEALLHSESLDHILQTMEEKIANDNTIHVGATELDTTLLDEQLGTGMTSATGAAISVAANVTPAPVMYYSLRRKTAAKTATEYTPVVTLAAGNPIVSTTNASNSFKVNLSYKVSGTEDKQNIENLSTPLGLTVPLSFIQNDPTAQYKLYFLADADAAGAGDAEAKELKYSISDGKVNFAVPEQGTVQVVRTVCSDDQHNYEVISESHATCEKEGTKVLRCKNCSDEKQESIEKLSHIYDEEGEVTTEPTCKDAGEMTFTCTVCKHEKTEEISKTDKHTWNEGVITTDPKCTTKGEKTFACTVCGETKTEEVAATDHSWDEGVITKEPDCTENGTKKLTCTVCGEPGEEVIEKLGHKMNATAAKAATCTAAGNTAYWTCSTCKKLYSDAAGTNEIIAAETVINATGHKMVKTEAKAATCTAAGNTAYWTCSTCNKLYGDAAGTNEITAAQTVINATGHKMVKTEAKAATCTAAGNTAYWTCSTCNKLYGDVAGTNEITAAQTVINATGHKPVTDPAVAATCTTAGKTEGSHCSVCGTTIKAQTAVPAKGHSWSGWSTTKEPTALAEGEQIRRCTNGCGATETQPLNKLTPTLKLNAASITLKTGQSTTAVKVTGLEKGDRVISWKSSNTKIVKVNAKTGKMTAQKKTGTAKITIKLASGKTATVKVTVQKKAVATKSIKGLPSKVTLKLKKTLKLAPVLNPITSTEKITYTTSNKKIVTVDKNGKLTAKKTGKAKITVKSGKKKFVITVTVKK